MKLNSNRNFQLKHTIVEVSFGNFKTANISNWIQLQLRPKEWENSASRFSVGAAGGKKKPAEGRAKENRVKCYTVKRGNWSQNGKVSFFISWMTFEELKLDCVQV